MENLSKYHPKYHSKFISKMMQESIEQNNNNTTNIAIWGSHFGAFCMVFVPLWRVFLPIYFFGTFAGTPKGDFGRLL